MSIINLQFQAKEEECALQIEKLLSGRFPGGLKVLIRYNSYIVSTSGTKEELLSLVEEEVGMLKSVTEWYYIDTVNEPLDWKLGLDRWIK